MFAGLAPAAAGAVAVVAPRSVAAEPTSVSASQLSRASAVTHRFAVWGDNLGGLVEERREGVAVEGAVSGISTEGVGGRWRTAPVMVTPQPSGQDLGGLAALFGVSRAVFEADNSALVARWGWDVDLPRYRPIRVYVRESDEGVVVTVQPDDNLDFYARLFGRPGYRSIVALNPQLAGNPALIRPGWQVRVLPAAPAPLPEPPHSGEPEQPGQPDRPDSPHRPASPPVEHPTDLTALWTVLGFVGAGLLVGLGTWALQRFGAAIGAAFGRGIRAVGAVLVRVAAGLRSARSQAARAMHWELPMQSGSARVALGAAASFGISFGGVLAVAASGPAATVLSIMTVGASVVAALRAWWSPAMARAPPAVLGVLAALVGAGGWVTTNLGALTDWIAANVVDLLMWAADELNRYTATGATILWVVATLITTSIPVRSVLHRQRMLRDLEGRVTRPRLDAAFSGAGYALVSIGNRVIQLLAAALPSWAGLVASGLAGTLVSALQRKLIGASRFWTAIVAGLTSLATLAWLPMITTLPAGLSDYLHDGLWFVGVLALAGWLGEYSVYWIGLLLRKVTVRLQRWLDRKASEISVLPGVVMRTTQRLVAWLLAEVTKRWLNALSLTKPDYRMTLLRTPDAALTAIISYFVVRPMPGLPENVVTQAIRIGFAVVLAVVQWKARNRLERKRNAQGTVSDQPSFTRERPIAPHRVQSRIGLVRERLGGFVRRVGLPVPDPMRDLTKPFAAEVVAELRAVLEQRLPDPADIEEMTSLDGKDFPGLAAKGRKLHQMWVDRHHQHRRAVRVVLMLMASRRTSIGGAADRLRSKDPAWRIAQFEKWMLDAVRDPAMVDLLLSEQDRRDLGLPESTREVLALLPGDWERVVRAELTLRHELRMAFLQLYIDLLEEWRAWLVARRPADKAEIARIDTRIKHERGRLERERRRDTDLPALVAAHDMLGGRRRSVRNALSMAKAQLRAVKPGGPAAKRLEQQIDLLERQAAALALVQATVSLLDEVEIHKYERNYWREQIDAVAHRPERIPRESLMAVLLFVANRTHPVTSADVAAALGAGVDRQAQLTMLAEIGAITGTQAGAYTASAQLAAAWAHAHPRLRHAVLTNPALLLLAMDEWDALPPGPLDPLLHTYIDIAATGERNAAAYGVAVLVEVLVGVQRTVFQHHTPGARDDWHRFRHRRDGRRYERRHPETQLDTSPSLTAPLEPVSPPMTFAEAKREMKAALKAAKAAMRDVWRAELELYRYIAGPNAPPAGDIDPATLPEEHRAARERLDAAVDVWATAFQRLAKVVERVEQDFPRPAARPMKLVVLLELAKALEAIGPGATADPVPAAEALRRVASDLANARKVLEEAIERREAVGDARAEDDYRNALAQAGIALTHFSMVRDRARDEKVTDQLLPRLVERIAERRVRKIVALAPQLAADAVVSVSGAAGTVDEWITPVSDDPSSRGAPVFEGVVPTPGPGVGVALYNARGAGRRVLQDVVGVRVDPKTGVIIAAIADGLSSGSRSERAARVAVEAVLVVVREEMTAGRTPGEAMNKAFHVAGAKVRALAAPAERTPPSTTLAAVVVEPLAHGRARVTWTHLGDSRIFVIKADRGIEQLTSDHTRFVEDGVTDSTAGWLTAWLGADAGFRAPDVRTKTISGPAAVLLTTDGLHGAFRSAQQLRTAVGARAHIEPALLVDRLQRAIGPRGNDASGIAVPIVGAGPSGGWAARAFAIAGLTGSALALPAAVGSTDRVAAAPMDVAVAEPAVGWLDGVSGSPVAAVVVVVALAVGAWALVRFLTRQHAPQGPWLVAAWFGMAAGAVGLFAGWLPWEAAAAAMVVPPAGSLGGPGGPAARRWHGLAARLREQFDADDREAFGAAMVSLRRVLAAHERYSAALDRARPLSVEARRWMGPIGQLALTGAFGSKADGVPEVAHLLAERDRVLLAGFSDFRTRRLWPASLYYPAERLGRVHGSVQPVVAKLVERQTRTAVRLYRESMRLNDTNRGRGLDHVLDEGEGAALGVLRVAEGTGLPLDWTFEGEFALYRLQHAADAVAAGLPEEQRVLVFLVARLATAVQEGSTWIEKVLNDDWERSRREVDAALDAAESLWSEQLLEWASSEERGPLRRMLSTYDRLRALDEAPADARDVERLLTDTKAARRQVEDRFVDPAVEDIGRYADLAIEFVRLHELSTGLAKLLDQADELSAGATLAVARRELQRWLAAELGRLAGEPGVAPEYGSAVAEYLEERGRVQRGDGPGRMSSAGLLGLAGLEGAPAWMQLVGLGVPAVAALWWGIRVVARGWTPHGPPHRLDRWIHAGERRRVISPSPAPGPAPTVPSRAQPQLPDPQPGAIAAGAVQRPDRPAVLPGPPPLLRTGRRPGGAEPGSGGSSLGPEWPRSGAAPSEVESWWAQLDPQARKRLAEEEPEWLGRLDGVPVDVRDAINREQLAPARDELMHRLALMPPRRDDAQETVQERDRISDLLLGVHATIAFLGEAQRTGRPARLLAFDTIGRGHAVLVLGDIDDADHVAVVVPGMSHQLGTINSAAWRLKWLWDAVHAVDVNPRTAIVAWWDYNMPPWFRDATAMEAAEAAVPRLASFIDGLRAVRGDRPVHLTVVAHSYGTIAFTLALLRHRWLLRDGDDAVFVGSPGIPAAHVSSLHVPDRTWASGAKRDPITYMAGLVGLTDPRSPYFGANVYDAGYGGDILHFVHETYFREVEPLRRLALIVLGRGHEVELVGPARTGVARIAERLRAAAVVALARLALGALDAKALVQRRRTMAQEREKARRAAVDFAEPWSDR